MAERYSLGYMGLSIRWAYIVMAEQYSLGFHSYGRTVFVWPVWWHVGLLLVPSARLHRAHHRLVNTKPRHVAGDLACEHGQAAAPQARHALCAHDLHAHVDWPLVQLCRRCRCTAELRLQPTFDELYRCEDACRGKAASATGEYEHVRESGS